MEGLYLKQTGLEKGPRDWLALPPNGLQVLYSLKHLFVQRHGTFSSARRHLESIETKRQTTKQMLALAANSGIR